MPSLSPSTRTLNPADLQPLGQQILTAVVLYRAARARLDDAAKVAAGRALERLLDQVRASDGLLVALRGEANDRTPRGRAFYGPMVRQQLRAVLHRHWVPCCGFHGPLCEENPEGACCEGCPDV